MDFGRPLTDVESCASKSKIRYLDPVVLSDGSTAATGATAAAPAPIEENGCANNIAQAALWLDNQVIAASNQIAAETFLGPLACSSSNGTVKQLQLSRENAWLIDATQFADRLTPYQETIAAGDLVVIQNSFDDLDFVYCRRGDVYTNRNGSFFHEDIIGKPFGTKLRSRTDGGYGFCFLLRPTPELWTRSLPHRTQVVHELDQSQIVWELHVRPNATVVESGTGSGALSHALLRTLAPAGHLHTYEFHASRAEAARGEFRHHRLDHLVTVHHRDVCHRQGTATLLEEEEAGTTTSMESLPLLAVDDDDDVRHASAGFDLPGQSVDAVVLDLPEPWLAVPHAAFVLRGNARIATYSPCMEQTQRTIAALQKCGFHSIKTMEYRLREHYVDEYEFEPPPSSKRVKPTIHNVQNYQPQGGTAAAEENDGGGVDDDVEEEDEPTSEVAANGSDNGGRRTNCAADESRNGGNRPNSETSGKRRGKLIVARPFTSMRGHSAFLTFATAGYTPQPDPNKV
jgi:tRNA (adenine57-N1/adenine58-N1)-methyltransferase catalytic subunit